MASKQEAAAVADSHESNSTALSTKQPTTFLSLPLELLQKILYRSLDVEIKIHRVTPFERISTATRDNVQECNQHLVAKAKERNCLWVNVMSKVYQKAQVNELFEECERLNRLSISDLEYYLVVRAQIFSESRIEFGKYLSG